MKKVILFVALILSFSFNSFSQTKTEDLKELFELMKTDKMIDDMMYSFIPSIKQQLTTQFSNEIDNDKLDKHIAILTRVAKELSKRVLNEEMLYIYDKYFTHYEIK